MLFPVIRGWRGFRARKSAEKHPQPDPSQPDPSEPELSNDSFAHQPDRESRQLSGVMRPAPSSFETIPRKPDGSREIPQDEGALENMFPLPEPVPGGWRGFDESHVARLHGLYYNLDIRVSQIAKVFRVSTSTLLRWIDEMGWSSRRQMRRDSMAVLREKGAELHEKWQRPPALPVLDSGRISDELDGLGETSAHRPDAKSHNVPVAALRADGEPLTPAQMVAEIDAAVRRELALMQQRTLDASAGAGERNARTLAALVRTLHSLEDLRGKQKGNGGWQQMTGNRDEKPPRDIAELREELVQKLRKIRAGQGGRQDGRQGGGG